MKKVQNVLRLHRCVCARIQKLEREFQGHFNIENVTSIMHYMVSVDINS